MPRISVVIPAYNASKTIAETLDAILAQSWPAVDVVVVDDGSKDDTRGALQPYADRARLIFQSNSGVSAARNRGVAEAAGDWVAFCDADDLWHADKLTVLAAVLQAAPDVDLVFHDFWTVINGTVVEARTTHSARTMFPLFKEMPVTIPDILTTRGEVLVPSQAFRSVRTWQGNAFRWLMLGNFLLPSTVAVRKRAFEAAGCFDREFRYAEDTEFFLRFAKLASFLWIEAPLAGYRSEAGTLLTGNMLPTILNATRAVVKHCVDDPAVLNSDPAWVKQAAGRRFTRLAYYCLSELKLEEARAHALTALRYDPRRARAWAIAAASLVPAPAMRLVRTLKSGGR